MTKYTWLAAAFLGAMLPLAAGAAAAPLPNIVFILADDLGWTDTGCYGSTFYETPNIDHFATEGMRFTDAYSACPVCSPSRAALMTGKTPARLHFTGHITARLDHPHPKGSRILPPNDLLHIPLEEITIAEAIKPAGYVSASIGKWHLGEKGFLPEDQGFDVNVGGWTAGSPPSYFWPYTNPKLEWNPSIPGLEEGGKPGEYLTDRLTDEAIKFLRKNRGRPTFLYLPHYAVHVPVQAPADVVAKYEAKSKHDHSQFNATYGAMVDRLDTNVGRLLRSIDEMGMRDNTVVIFASDNGGEGKVTHNTPLRAGKGFLYEGGIRVPLIVRWPGHISPGTVSHVPVISHDLCVTLVDIIGQAARPGSPLDGVSLRPLLEETGTLAPRSLYWYYPQYPPQGAPPGAAVRHDRFKLIETYDPVTVQLFDLSRDLGEEHDLAAVEPDRRDALLKELHDWEHAVDAPPYTMNPDAAR